MTKFHAQPYDISATGFYFESAEEFSAKLSKAVNDYGDPVEEFEILFIDDDSTDNSVKVLDIFAKENTQIDLILLKNERISNSPKKMPLQQL